MNDIGLRPFKYLESSTKYYKSSNRLLTDPKDPFNQSKYRKISNSQIQKDIIKNNLNSNVRSNINNNINQNTSLRNSSNYFPNLEPMKIYQKRFIKMNLKKSTRSYSNNPQNTSNIFLNSNMLNKTNNFIRLYPDKATSQKNISNITSSNLNNLLNTNNTRQKHNLKIVNTEMLSNYDNYDNYSKIFNNFSNYNQKCADVLNGNLNSSSNVDKFNLTRNEQNIRLTESNNVFSSRSFKDNTKQLHTYVSTDKSTMKETTTVNSKYNNLNQEDIIETPEELHFYYIKVIQGGKNMEKKLYD